MIPSDPRSAVVASSYARTAEVGARGGVGRSVAAYGVKLYVVSKVVAGRQTLV